MSRNESWRKRQGAWLRSHFNADLKLPGRQTRDFCHTSLPFNLSKLTQFRLWHIFSFQVEKQGFWVVLLCDNSGLHFISSVSGSQDGSQVGMIEDLCDTYLKCITSGRVSECTVNCPWRKVSASFLPRTWRLLWYMFCIVLCRQGKASPLSSWSSHNNCSTLACDKDLLPADSCVIHFCFVFSSCLHVSSCFYRQNNGSTLQSHMLWQHLEVQLGIHQLTLPKTTPPIVTVAKSDKTVTNKHEISDKSRKYFWRIYSGSQSDLAMK